MPRYEYKVIPAPSKGQKAKGVKTPEGRFALSVETVLNEMGAEGWEYLRAELLPSDERSGLTGSATNWRNVLVFRRAAEDDVAVFQPEEIDLPVLVHADPPVGAPAPLHADDTVAAPAPISETPQEPPFEGATRMLKDNGVEEVSEVVGMTSALRARAAGKAEKSGDEGESDKPT